VFAQGFSTYRSDLLVNYEFGAKTEWLDRRLQLNVAAYHMKWNDIQIQVEDPQVNLFQLGFVNFPEAKIDGVEADVRWVPTDNWDFGGSMSYNDARISETATLTASGGTFSIRAIEGTRLPITPDWKFSVYGEYTFPTELLGAIPYARFDFSHTGDSVNSLAGIEAIIGGVATETQQSYDIGDFKIGLEADMWNASFLDRMDCFNAVNFSMTNKKYHFNRFLVWMSPSGKYLEWKNRKTLQKKRQKHCKKRFWKK